MKLLFTLSGSSGSGKTTLLDLLSRDLAINISVSHTTRERREYEIDGIPVSYTHLRAHETLR